MSAMQRVEDAKEAAALSKVVRAPGEEEVGVPAHYYAG